MSKYEPLKNFLHSQRKETVTLTFREIEEIIEDKLPKTSYNNGTWWANDKTSHVQARAWLDIGWKTEEKVLGEKITFKKEEV